MVPRLQVQQPPVPVDVRGLPAKVPVVLGLRQELRAGATPSRHLEKMRHLVRRQSAGGLQLQRAAGELLRLFVAFVLAQRVGVLREEEGQQVAGLPVADTGRAVGLAPAAAEHGVGIVEEGVAPRGGVVDEGQAEREDVEGVVTDERGVEVADAVVVGAGVGLDDLQVAPLPRAAARVAGRPRRREPRLDVRPGLGAADEPQRQRRDVGHRAGLVGLHRRGGHLGAVQAVVARGRAGEGGAEAQVEQLGAPVAGRGQPEPQRPPLRAPSQLREGVQLGVVVHLELLRRHGKRRREALARWPGAEEVLLATYSS